MANRNINSPVVDPESGYIDFPLIKEDATDVFLHNYAAFMNRITTLDIDRPKQWLIVGNSDGSDIELTKTDIKDWNYSHKELRSAAQNSEYKHLEATVRKDYTYGDVNVFFMKDAESSDEQGIVINDNHIAFSFDLGKPIEFYPDEYILNARRMNKWYNFGDIAYTTSRRHLPSYMRLRCVKSGRTSGYPFVLSPYVT